MEPNSFGQIMKKWQWEGHSNVLLCALGPQRSVEIAFDDFVF